MSHLLQPTQQQTILSNGFVAYETQPEDFIAHLDHLAVLQFSSVNVPNVDALHQLLVKQSVTLSSQPPQSSQTNPVIAPTQRVFAPYQAHSTVHTQKALWALLMPRTVPNHVRDVWRGYFAQALYKSLPLNVAYVPYTTNNNNMTAQYLNRKYPKNLLAEAKSELEWHVKTDLLLEFLHTWQCRYNDNTNNNNHHHHQFLLAFCMEELWIDLYQQHFIELEDVTLVQLWLEALVEIKYKFPSMPTLSKRHDNVVVMGQFNFADSSLQDVLFWNQKWLEWVNRTVVRGPFTDLQRQELHLHGMEAFHGRDDKGFVSPLENFVRTLRQYRHTDGIAGILYVHDDAIANLHHLFHNTDNKQHMLASFDVRDPRKPVNEGHAQLLNKLSYKIRPDGTFVKQNGYQTNNTNELLESLNDWWHHPACLSSLSSVAHDPRSHRYRDDQDGSFMVPIKGQSDFFYVPMSLADAFIDAAQLLVDHNVFLECAFPTVVDMLLRNASYSGASVREAKLCTTWDVNLRGTLEMMDHCGLRPEQIDVLHPFKMKQHGYRTWGNTFDKLASTAAH